MCIIYTEKMHHCLVMEIQFMKQRFNNIIEESISKMQNFKSQNNWLYFITNSIYRNYPCFLKTSCKKEMSMHIQGLSFDFLIPFFPTMLNRDIIEFCTTS